LTGSAWPKAEPEKRLATPAKIKVEAAVGVFNKFMETVKIN
jgi:hypothetical protein